MIKKYTIKLKPVLLVLLITVLFSLKGFSQIKVPFTPRASDLTPNKTIYNIKGDFSMIGNTNLKAVDYSDSGNNNGSMVYVDIDNDTDTWNSSSSTLVLPSENGALPECSNIIYAGLYWTGSAKGDDKYKFSVTKDGKTKEFDKRKILFKTPNSAEYIEIKADDTDIYFPLPGEDSNMYSAYAEVTNLINPDDFLGEYFAANLALKEGVLSPQGYHGGWGMVVIYENSNMDWRSVTVFDGHAHVGGLTANYSFDVNGFNTAQNGDINVKLGVMAAEGDFNLGGDYFEIQRQDDNTFQRLSHASNTSNNFFNSSINTGGYPRNPDFKNNYGLDIAMFNLDNTNNGIIANNQTSTIFKYGTQSDRFVIFNVTFSVNAYVPELEGVLKTTSINGNSNTSNLSLLPGESVDYLLEIKNKGSEATKNTVITIPIPYTSTYKDLSIQYHTFTPFSTSNVPYYDPNLGATGSIVWDLGNLPFGNPNDVLADIGFSLTATTDCSLLVNASCDSSISLGGSISGTGVTSNVSINQEIIQGYETTGNCIGEPIPTPSIIFIDAEDYVNANCNSYAAVRDFYFCNIGSTPIQTSQVKEAFPPGTKYYNEYPLTETSIQYNASNPFLPTLGTSTYYAIPMGSTLCYYQFTIEVTNVSSVPKVENVSYCLNETANPLTALPSDSPTSPSSFTLYYYTDNNPSTNAQNIIVPLTNDAGETTYYVAEGLSNSCISPNRVPIKVTVYGALNVITENITNVSCTDGNDGAIDISVNNGSGNYSYDWDNNGTQDPDTDTQNLSGLVAGTYTVIVTDTESGCSITKGFEISITADIILPTVICPADVTANVDTDSCTAAASNVTLETPITADNCGVAKVENDAPTSFPIGDTTVTWTVTDNAGNIAICEQKVTVTDNINPTISCSETLNVNVDTDACTADAANINLETPITADNCGVSNVKNDAPTSFPIGDTIITWTVTDNAGNIATCEQKVTVTDNILPTITCPATVNVNVDADACTTDATNINLGTPITADNCGVAKVENDAPTSFPIGDTTITWTVTDNAGNIATCEQKVTVTDNINPTITCSAAINVNVDADACTANAANITLGTPTTADNCGVAKVENDAPTNFPIGDTTVTWTVTDNAGNIATCEQKVIVTDNINPTITCPETLNVNVDSDACTADAANINLGTPITADNCGVAKVENDAPTNFPIGDTTIIWTVTDNSGNIATCEQKVTVTDNINPTITCPATVIINADADACTADAVNINLGTPITADNCGVAKVENDAPTSFPIGDTTITWTVTDNAGNIATCEQKVTVTDNINPTITCPVAINVNVDADACTANAANINLGTPTTADNCGVAKVENDAPTSFPIGDTTITWTVTDNAGNTETCTQTVTVTDNIKPIITCPATINVNVDADACTADAANINLGIPITSDNCGVAKVENDAPTSFPIGDTKITWTVTDNSGNTETCTQTVTVTDSTPPLFVESLPVDATYECDSVPDANTLTATDACGTAEVTFSEERTDGSCISNYTLKRTWVATDLGGLTTTYTQTITVQDTKAPQPTTTFDATITISCENIPDKPLLEFKDNCSTDVTVVFDETNTFDKNNPSDYKIVRTWKVSDSCNNEEAFTQTITVTLNDFVNQVSDRACSDDGPINLDDYLDNNQTGGTWTLIEGDTTLDQNIFDPESVALGNYRFTYKATNDGCLAITELTLEIHDECIVLPCGIEDVIISKVVTPNGDTYNDYFTVEGVETCGFIVELQIFNRWGAKIYENFNYQNNWNGFAHKSSVGKADKVPNGTYYYIINLKDSGLKPFARAFYVGTK